MKLNCPYCLATNQVDVPSETPDMEIDTFYEQKCCNCGEIFEYFEDYTNCFDGEIIIQKIKN